MIDIEKNVRTYLGDRSPVERASSFDMAIRNGGGVRNGTVIFAFHDSLLAHPTAAGLNTLLFGGGAVGWVVSFTGLMALRRFAPARIAFN